MIKKLIHWACRILFPWRRKQVAWYGTHTWAIVNPDWDRHIKVRGERDELDC